MIKAAYNLAHERDCLTAFHPPITCSKPSLYNHGVIFASPHSGRIYPEGFLAQSILPLRILRQNEDAYMDDMIAPVIDHDIPVLTANFPRCFVDVNRAPDEVLAQWSDTPNRQPTQRAKLGLGVIPTVMSETQAIYSSVPPVDIVKPRLDALYRPYHSALKGLIEQALTSCGQALIIDCHSMPGVSLSGRQRADIILGDRFATSAHETYVALIEDHFQTYGYRVARNYPYAGGYVTSHYGRPNEDIHVIQIEVNRGLYLNPVTYERKVGFSDLQTCFTALGQTLKHAFGHKQLRAAE